MGKPFATELEALPDSYQWAMSQPIDCLTRIIGKMCGDSLIALGSGGSFSVSQFACHLHSAFSHEIAMPLTPLQAATGDYFFADAGILVPTARGNNPDVVGAVRDIILREPRHVAILCANPGSRISRLAARYPFVDLIEYQMPFGADGFLATNSLLAFSVLLARSYAAASGVAAELPKRISGLLHDKRELTNPKWLDSQYAPLWERRTLVVLHGAAAVTAAVDVESKFTEAAIGNVQIADFRQFAHGRHHWLAKHAKDTAVVALVSQADEAVAKQTLAIIPKQIPTYSIELQGDGWLADLSGLVQGFFLVGSAGRARGIDPGRPGVPPFGRKLYHANAFERRSDGRGQSLVQRRAIERKAKEPMVALERAGRTEVWTQFFNRFVERLTQANFAAVVFDYDGTLCDEDQRHEPLPADVVKAVGTLLSAGVIMGVATGRGKSVRESLRHSIAKKYWKQIIVGYYNGGEVLALDSEEGPDGSQGVGAELTAMRTVIDADSYLQLHSVIAYRLRQITLTPTTGTPLTKLWAYCQHLVQRTEHTGVRALRSGHSIDLLPDGITKSAVVQAVRATAGVDSSAPVLCIGDRGCWPGNDFELLEGDYSLSVYQVSPDPNSCWNLAPPGQRGLQAALTYMKAMKFSRRGIRLSWPGLRGEHP